MDSQWHAYDDDKVRTIVAGDVFYSSCFGFFCVYGDVIDLWYWCKEGDIVVTKEKSIFYVVEK